MPSSYVKKLAEKFDGITVVLTHHVPHPECTPAAYTGMKANYLFASVAGVFGQLLHSDMAPGLWIYGHTHQVLKFELGELEFFASHFVISGSGTKTAFDGALSSILRTIDLTTSQSSFSNKTHIFSHGYR